jgi:general secretion pathway protein K
MYARRVNQLHNQADDGFVVVAALWILGALAALCSIYMTYVVSAVADRTLDDDRLQVEASVSAALEVATYRLTAEKTRRSTRGTFSLHVVRATVAASYCSEAARIDLNMASKDLLGGLFAAIGARYSDAKMYADRVVGWRTKPGIEGLDRETSAYRAAGLDYGPRGAPFAHVDELWRVLGLPANLVGRAMPYVTVFSGRAEINILDAAPEVVAALPGMTSERLYTVLKQRDARPVNADAVLTLLGEGRMAATVEGSPSTRVTVQIQFDNGRRVGSEVVILVIDDMIRPYRVLSWSDDFDGPSSGQVPNGGGR